MLLIGKLGLASGLALALLVGTTARAASPFTGKFAVWGLLNTNEIHLCNITVAEKDGKPEVRLGALLPDFDGQKLDNVKGDDKALHFALTGARGSFQLALYADKGKHLRGSLSFNDQAFPAFAEPVEDVDADITPKNASRPTPGAKELLAALHVADKEKRIKDLTELMEKNEGKPVEYLASAALYEAQASAGAAPAAIKKSIDKTLALAAVYGPDVENRAVLAAAHGLLRGKDGELALVYAEKVAAHLEEALKAGPVPPPRKLAVGMLVLQAQAKAGAPVEAIKKTIDKVMTAAKGAGPGGEANAHVRVTRALLKSKEAELALEHARKIAEGVKEDDPPAKAIPPLKLLAAALHKASKKDEAKEVDGRVAKIEHKLDEDFEKSAIGFQPEPFAGRTSKSDRVAVVELFTGAQCPPCVSADIAFDAALKAFKPKDVVLLQYHLHIPGPDALTNADSEARQGYYEEDVRGTPSMFINGKVTEGMGGFKPHGKERFGTLSSAIEKALEITPKAQIKLKVTRKGDVLDLAADVDEVQAPGDKTRLRFVLIEDVVRYPGRNGQRLHHHVVRAFPGGVKGFALKEKSSKHTAKVSLHDLREVLSTYLEEADSRRPFAEDERPLDLEHLKVVALVQDDDNKEIGQAVQADVPE